MNRESADLRAALRALYVEGVQSGHEKAIELLDCRHSRDLLANVKEDDMREAGAFFDAEYEDPEWPVLAQINRALPERERRCEHGEMMIAPRCSKCSMDAILGRDLAERNPFPYYCCVSCGTRLSGCDACRAYFTEQPSPDEGARRS